MLGCRIVEVRKIFGNRVRVSHCRSQEEQGTVLYHAVNAALDKLNSATFPNDLTNVSIVTFTDGLDIGSYRLNDEFKEQGGAAYLASVKKE